MRDSQNDFRYPVTVILMRDERPRYWEFHCPYCASKVCELDGVLVHLLDISNDDSANRSAVRIRCPGGKKWCRMWFEIKLLN